MNTLLTAATVAGCWLAAGLLVVAWINADRYLARRADRKRVAAVVADQNRRAAIDRQADEIAAEIIALVYGQKLKAADEADIAKWESEMQS